MNGADDGAGSDDERAEPALTADRLADMQAGLVDDADAAQLRRRIRADAAARHRLGALHRVRNDVAALGADAASAPEVPAAVVARVRTALRSATSPASGPHVRVRAAHSARPGLPPARAVAAVAGIAAAIIAIGLGTAALLRAGAPTANTPTAQHITVSNRTVAIPLSAEQILGLLDRSPDYGGLGDPTRRSSCLSGLGYPTSTRVLGAQLTTINGLPVVLLVLPGDTPDALAVVAVSPNCSSADTGLVADTVVRRP